jgi:hypothetical protein
MMNWLNEQVERIRRNEGDYDHPRMYLSSSEDYRREQEVRSRVTSYVMEEAHKRLYLEIL